MLPALVGSIGAIYTVGKAYNNIRYWNDYRRNTGKSPKYPFRAGAYDWMGYAGGTGYAFSRLKRL